MDKAHGRPTGMRFPFYLVASSYVVKAQTHTCRTSMGSNIGPCPNINFLYGLTSLKTIMYANLA